MFLKLAHEKLEIYAVSRQLAVECYRITRSFPNDEKYAMVQQIRRAALSVHLNFAEGCSRKSAKERRRFYEISRGSLVEVDTALAIASQLSYVNEEELAPLGVIILKTFKILSAMINDCVSKVRSE